MILCDACLRTVLGPEVLNCVNIGGDDEEGPDPFTAYLCGPCMVKMVRAAKVCMEGCRPTTLKNAVPSLTPEQESRIMAYIHANYEKTT